MNTSNAFRSHLMQQFVSQARTQSRPPLALLGIFSDDNEAQNLALQAGTNPGVASLFSSSRLSCINSTQSFTSNVRRRHTDSEIVRSSHSDQVDLEKNKLHLTLKLGEKDAVEDTKSSDDSQQRTREGLSQAFQTMIQTRRSSGRLIPLKILPPLYEHQQNFWIDALDRAVQCGQQAPNHKRTEPFTFKRMIAVSEATKRLADIAYHVDLRQRLNGTTRSSSTTTDDGKSISKCDVDIVSAQNRAQRKREKWSQIPAFLVTVVTEETYDDKVDSSTNEYETLPYQPPLTERALEDYASACAAVQNVLLSLHSEHISTKWVTGPVIRTPAFRDLIQLEENNRVVALIMVGANEETFSTSSPSTSSGHRRRNRRQLHGDVLVDL